MSLGIRGSTDNTSLWDLIIATQLLRCSEPRDIVYALLGVASEREKLGIGVASIRPIPDLLSLVLRIHYENQPPESLDQAARHCTELGLLFGDRDILFSLVVETQSVKSVEMHVFAAVDPSRVITPRWTHSYGHSQV